jgi:hypothetical protein
MAAPDNRPAPIIAAKAASLFTLFIFPRYFLVAGISRMVFATSLQNLAAADGDNRWVGSFALQ